MVHEVLVATEAELRAVVRLDLAAIDVVERAFAALHAGSVTMPPILSMAIPEANGEVDVKTAFISGFNGFAIKVSPGFFDNPQIGIPSLNGLMILFSSKTGLVEALFLDNGYLTDVRTAAAGAVATRHLAPDHVDTAGVIGTGVQARLQLQAAHMVKPFNSALVWGRSSEKAEQCAHDLEAALGIEVHPENDPARVVEQSQLVVTATPAQEPILQAEWLHPGLHITAMGSDQADKNEIAPKAIGAADLYVCDRVSQCELLGELRSARAAGHLVNIQPPELGSVVAGETVGRKADDDVTICDLTGTGAQDTAIATSAHASCLAAGIGSRIQT